MIRANFRLGYKLVFFVFYTVCYLFCAATLRISIRTVKKRRFYFARNSSFWIRRGLKLLNISVQGINQPLTGENYLYVSNHTGMLDILCFSSLVPTLYVTSVEMKNTPGLGLLCEMGGCLFVERRSRSQIQAETQEIREALIQGNSVVLYPEGTSTNGERMLPFKRTLMTSIVGTSTKILPMVINYLKVNGEPMGPKYRDTVFWYGDLNFLGSFLRILALESCEVSIEFFKPVPMESLELRDKVVAEVQTLIETKFVPIPK